MNPGAGCQGAPSLANAFVRGGDLAHVLFSKELNVSTPDCNTGEKTVLLVGIANTCSLAWAPTTRIQDANPHFAITSQAKTAKSHGEPFARQINASHSLRLNAKKPPSAAATKSLLRRTIEVRKSRKTALFPANSLTSKMAHVVGVDCMEDGQKS